MTNKDADKMDGVVGGLPYKKVDGNMPRMSDDGVTGTQSSNYIQIQNTNAVTISSEGGKAQGAKQGVDKREMGLAHVYDTLRYSLDRDYSVYVLGGTRFSFFFFPLHAFQLRNRSYCSRTVSYCSCTVYPFFNHFFIKNGSYDTIHIFKNYFATVFSVFSKNKLYPNRP